MISISIQTEDFDIGSETQALRCRNLGAIASFIGTVRDIDNTLETLTLEHYPEMAQRHLQKIAQKAQEKWDISTVRIIHRYGTLKPLDSIVFVACSSAHRTDAFNGVHFIMDYLKTSVPFWKQETFVMDKNTPQWVQHNNQDDTHLEKWQK